MPFCPLAYNPNRDKKALNIMATYTSYDQVGIKEDVSTSS